MDKMLEEELFSDDTEAVQQEETKKGLLKFRKLFAAVDATVISIITPEAGEVMQDDLEQSPKTCDENDATKTEKSVLDDAVSQISLKEDNPKKPEGKDDVDILK